MSLKLIIASLILICVLTANYNHPNNFSTYVDIKFDSIINRAYGQENSSDTSTEYSVYKNEKHGFVLEYPSHWTFDERKSDALAQTDFVYLVASPDTYISISKSLNDIEFSGLSGQQYLDRMITNYQEECNIDSLDEHGFACSNFEPILSIVDSDGKYLSYMIGYTYTESSNDAVTDKSNLVIQIPERKNIWIITVFSTTNDLPNHLEEIGTTLNSFTILAESQAVESDISAQGTSKSGGCLIATATYGSELAPQVQFLREIRDNTVLSTASGTSFMTAFNSFYYSFSPAVADLERQNPAFKEFVKLTITPLLSSLSLLQYIDIDSEEKMLGYGIGIILLNIGMYFVAPAILITKLKKRLAVSY